MYTSLQNRAVDQLHQACTFIKTENIAVNEIGQNRAVDQLHQAFTFIKTENIAVNEIGRIICSHILLHAQ